MKKYNRLFVLTVLFSLTSAAIKAACPDLSGEYKLKNEMGIIVPITIRQTGCARVEEDIESIFDGTTFKSTDVFIPDGKQHRDVAKTSRWEEDKLILESKDGQIYMRIDRSKNLHIFNAPCAISDSCDQVARKTHLKHLKKFDRIFVNDEEIKQ